MKLLISRFCIHLLLLGGAMLIIYPVYLVFIMVFKTPMEAAESYFSLPRAFNLDNLRKVFSMSTIWSTIRNSFAITIISAAIISILVPMVSYSISRNYNKRYFKSLFYLFLSGMFVPMQMLMLPTVKMMSKLGLTNPLGLVLIYLSGSLIQGTFLCVGYLRTVPLELDEAAEMDGCNVGMVFMKVIYPVMRPIVVTLLIINSLTIWNEFLLPLILLNKSMNFWTLPLLQFNLKARTDLGTTVQFASYILTVFPMLTLYIFTQKYIISGLTDGSLKN